MRRSLVAALLLGAACARPGESPAPAPPPAEASARPESSAGPEDLGLPSAPGSLAPWLALSPEGRVHASWLEPAPDEGGHHLRWSRWSGGGWSEPATIPTGGAVLANWADVPKLLPLPSGRLVASWPALQAGDGHGYDLAIATSEDGGATWSAAAHPHDDGTATEHGFAALLPLGGAEWSVAWLDGRDHAERAPPAAATALRAARLGAGGRPTDARVLDARTCDCCPLAAAITADGPVIAYRDRGDDEVRDVSVVRREGDQWTAPRGVSADGWRVAGCPVNGPSLAASGRRVVLAWFTAADDVPAAWAAFSLDAGRTFAAPVRVDDGAPVGRVSAGLLSDGDAAVAWLEGDALLVRRVTATGSRGAAIRIGEASGRAAGMPQLLVHEGAALVAWTTSEPEARVRVARLALPPA